MKKLRLRFDDSKQYPTASQYQQLSLLTLKRGQDVYKICLQRLGMKDDLIVGSPKTWTYRTTRQLIQEMKLFEFPTSDQMLYLTQHKGDERLNELISNLKLHAPLLNKLELSHIIKELQC